MNLSSELKTDLQAIQRIEASLAHINNHVKEIDKNVQAVELRLETYNSTLKVNTAQLAEHIRRTELAERALVLLEAKAEASVKAVADKTESRIQVTDGRFFALLATLVVCLLGATFAFLLKK